MDAAMRKAYRRIARMSEYLDGKQNWQLRPVNGKLPRLRASWRKLRSRPTITQRVRELRERLNANEHPCAKPERVKLYAGGSRHNAQYKARVRLVTPSDLRRYGVTVEDIIRARDALDKYGFVEE